MKILPFWRDNSRIPIKDASLYSLPSPKTQATLSIDVEDWYHGLEFPISSWSNCEKRLHQGMDQILEILEEYNIKATFFVLGVVAKEYPSLVRKIADLNHEVGSHSMFHEKLYEMSRKKFRKQEADCKKIIEDTIGTNIKGFRAPFFSIIEENLWALDTLKELDYAYDSSLSPVITWRYGIPGTKEGIYSINNGIIEITPSSMKFFGRKLGIGGAYMRILPTRLTSKALADGRKGLYVHPWEFDVHHPRVKLPLLPKFTHYINLQSTRRKFKTLCEQFNFIPMGSVFENAINNEQIVSLKIPIQNS